MNRCLHPVLTQMVLKGSPYLTKDATRCFIRVFGDSISMIERLFKVWYPNFVNKCCNDLLSGVNVCIQMHKQCIYMYINMLYVMRRVHHYGIMKWLYILHPINGIYLHLQCFQYLFESQFCSVCVNQCRRTNEWATSF